MSSLPSRTTRPTPGPRPQSEPARRLLYVFGSLERAGAQLRALEVCRELQRQHEIDYDICSVDLGPNELADDVERLGGSAHVVSLRSPFFPLRFLRFLQRGRYDALNTEPQLLSGIIVWVAAMSRVPQRIVTIHNSIGDPGQSARSRLVRLVLANALFVWIMRTLIVRFATDVVAVSHSALDSVLPPRWRVRCASRVIYNGTDLGPFGAPADRLGVRSEFGWDQGSRIIVHVGRLSPQKNHATILETVRLVHDTDPSIRLLLVGDGPLRNEVERAIDRLGLREICRITNERLDVPRLLLASDVFFFPSSWEGLPGAPLEALAAGLPVVASDIPSMREISPHFPDRIRLAPPKDSPRHAEHLRAALANSGDRAGASARFAETPFSFETSVDAYRSLYEIDGPGDGHA